LRLYFCPACARVYYLSDYWEYLCGRNHATSVWPDGKQHRFFVSETTQTNRPPWAIPKVVEERELLNQEVIETWLDSCKYPEDENYGDLRRHFGYGAPGGKHLSKEQVLEKYGQFVLKPVEADLTTD
jgi:hypothetical protein